MKTKFVLISIFCFCFFLFRGIGLFADQETGNNLSKVEKLLGFFIDKGEISDKNKSGLLSQYERLSPQDKVDIENIPFDSLLVRFSRFVQAKKVAMGGIQSNIVDISDFNWEYLKRDFESWAVASIISSDAVNVYQVVSGPQVTAKGFDIEFDPMKENKILIPIIDKEFTVYASGPKGNVAWHAENVKESEKVSFPRAFSEGVELYVSSNPTGALIYFNGKKFYGKTDTTCVRSPGECTLVIRKDGYQDWLKKYNFNKGEIYKINADLVPSGK